MTSEGALRLVVGAAAFALISALWAVRRPARHRQHLSRPRPQLAAAMVVIAAVVAAAGPGPSVVGVGLLDRLARAALVLIVGGAGVFATPAALGLAALLLTAGLAPTGAGAAAAGFTGATLAVVAARIDPPPWLRGATAVALVAVATRPTAHGGALTYLVPGVALAVIVAGGLLSTPRSARRRVWGVAGLLVAAVVLVTGLGGIAALQSRARFTTGLTSARAALADVKAARVDAARQDLARAQRELTAGRRRLRSWWARPAWAMPFVGVNMRSVDAAAATGAALGGVGANVVAAAQVKQLHIAGGQVPLDALGAMDGPLHQAESSLTDAFRVLSRLRSRWLVPSVRDRLGEFEARITDADRTAGLAVRGERVAIAMLGGNHAPRRYFLALSSPSELRGALGLIGNYGEVVASDGHLTLDRFGRIDDLIVRAPASPDGLGWDPTFVATYRSALAGTLWQNLTISPDFPTVADAIEKLYPVSGGEPIDGVISVDPQGLAALLRLDGPITVPTWPVPLTAASIAQVLEHDEYNAFLSTDTRAAFLATVTAAVVAGVRTANLSNLADVLSALGTAAAGKHILVASAHPDEETELARAPLGGAVLPINGDALGVFSTNAAANKIDWFLHRAERYAVTVSGSTLTADLTIRLTNTAPASGEAPILIGSAYPHPPPSGTNRTILSILTPWTPGVGSLDGQPVALTQTAYLGRKLLSVGIDIPPGTTRTLTVHLSGTTRPGRYHLDVTSQPTAVPDSFSLVVNSGGRTSRTDVDLSHDTSFAA